MHPVHVLWHSAGERSSEHCVLAETPAGWRISGVTVLPVDAASSHIEYSVDTGPDWETRRAHVAVYGARRLEWEAVRLEEGWAVNGTVRDDLSGCTDVDLGWTPATNTLPIRRLGLDVGESATTVALWLRFPEFDLTPLEQRYTRTTDRLWRYSSGSFDAEIAVDEHGLAQRYGNDLWTAIAVSRS